MNSWGNVYVCIPYSILDLAGSFSAEYGCRCVSCSPTACCQPNVCARLREKSQMVIA